MFNNIKASFSKNSFVSNIKLNKQFSFSLPNKVILSIIDF